MNEPTCLSPSLRAVIRCPVCRGPLAWWASEVRCTACLAQYAIIRGIPSLVPTALRSGREAEFYNASDPFRYGRDGSELSDQMRGDIFTFVDSLPRDALVVEVGSGRGAFTGCHPRYVALDFSFEALDHYGAGPRIQASAETLPFADSSIDAFFTLATLEHVPNPALALAELHRCLRPHGRAYIYPAWYVRPWASDGLGIRAYRTLSTRDRVRKLSILARDRRPYQFLKVAPSRLAREGALLFGRRTPFRRRQLRPNLTEYITSDSDAFSSLDPHSAACFFVTRGYRDERRPSVLARIAYGYEPVVVQRGPS